MKYKTFQALMFVLGGAVVLGTCTGGYVLCSKQSKPEPAAARAEPTERPHVDTATATPSSWDATVASMMGKPAEGDKKKDALGSRGPKVNLYAEDGSKVWNRAKVDLDRDEKWDEKWTLKDGVIERQIAPGDDEQYTKSMSWRNGKWESPGEEPAAASGAVAAGWEGRLLEMLKQPATGDKGKDALGAGGPKVNLYADGGASSWNRAKVDLDRDEKWDEKWTVKDNTVERQIAPNDDEVYTKRLVLRDGVWAEK